MMNEQALDGLERIARGGNTDRVYEALRQFSLRDIGELLLGVPDRCTALQRVLPRMPPNDVQISWTGSSGPALLEQSLAFVGGVASSFESIARRPLTGATILDYGCGWGRLIRLMYKFSGPDRIHGCDAWVTSLDLCREYGVQARLALCDEVPRDLPFDGPSFDLIYAFSVFTHLSERTSQAVITTLRRHVDLRGLLAVTIRPPEYWQYHSQQQNPVDVARMMRDHAARGFAFTPHNRAPIDGDISMSLEYIEKNWLGWSVLGSSIDPADPGQRLVLLKPR